MTAPKERDAELASKPPVFDPENGVASVDSGVGFYAPGERVLVTERAYIDMDSGEELFREGVNGL